ncbi:MAG: hypothetical protein MJ229_03525 [bacterium]|nr:hypothetical protein [bacterium]
MKKIFGIVAGVAFSLACANTAFADGNAFTPLDFNDSYSAPKAAPAAAKDLTSKAVSDISAASGEVPIGNDSIQNAILELDNAQVGIRNDLLNYKAKYADVDAQYKLIKNERAMLAKQVRSIEKRIKNIDKSKEKIRKNML